LFVFEAANFVHACGLTYIYGNSYTPHCCIWKRLPSACLIYCYFFENVTRLLVWFTVPSGLLSSTRSCPSRTSFA
jgi:hypothetical protein